MQIWQAFCRLMKASCAKVVLQTLAHPRDWTMARWMSLRFQQMTSSTKSFSCTATVLWQKRKRTSRSRRKVSLTWCKRLRSVHLQSYWRSCCLRTWQNGTWLLRESLRKSKKTQLMTMTQSISTWTLSLKCTANGSLYLRNHNRKS